MATVASIAVELKALTAKFDAAMAASGQNAAKMGNQAKAAAFNAGSAFTAAGYAAQDFAAVLAQGGKNALPRALAGIGNNVQQLALAFPDVRVKAAAMIAGIGLSMAPMIASFAGWKEEIDDTGDKLEKLAKAGQEAAERIAKSWDDARASINVRMDFAEKINNPNLTAKSATALSDEIASKQVRLEADYKSKLAQGNELLNSLNAANKTGLGSAFMQKGGIEAIDPKQLGALKFTVEAAHNDNVGMRVGAAAGGLPGAVVGAVLTEKDTSATGGAFKALSDEERKSLQTAVDAVKKAKQDLEENTRIMKEADARTQNLVNTELAAELVAKDKEVADAVQHNADMIARVDKQAANAAALQTEDFNQRVLQRFQSSAGSTIRPGVGSAGFGTSEAYSAIAAATRTEAGATIKDVVDQLKKEDETAKRTLAEIKKFNAKPAPPVADF